MFHLRRGSDPSSLAKDQLKRTASGVSHQVKAAPIFEHLAQGRERGVLSLLKFAFQISRLQPRGAGKQCQSTCAVKIGDV